MVSEVQMFLCQDAVMLCCVSDSMSITDRQTEPLQEVLADLKSTLNLTSNVLV